MMKACSFWERKW